MIPLHSRRKTRKIEKVENVCRTAPEQWIFANTAVHIGSRWRDSAGDRGRIGRRGKGRTGLPEISHFVVEF
jgi:hypothetical protein